MSLTDSIAGLSVQSIRSGLRQKAFSARELTQAALEFAQAENPKTGAYLTFSPERALAAAARVDSQIAKGEPLGELAGVPLGVKDVIVTKGLKTTCGSRILEHYIPPYDATAVIRLEEEGAVSHRQDELRRVRHGLFERELGLWTRPESGRIGSCPRRFQRRIGGGGCTGYRCDYARLRHRRLHSTASQFLWRGRCYTDVRARVTLRFGSVSPVRWITSDHWLAASKMPPPC